MIITKLAVASLALLQSTLFSPTYASSPLQASDDNLLLSTTEYTFETYTTNFSKSYEPNSSEWNKRRDIFYTNLKKIVEHNQAFVAKDASEEITHVLGVNDFTDMEEDELFLGYDKSAHPAWSSSSKVKAAMLLEAEESGDTKISRRNLEESHAMDLPFDIDPIESLPKSIDWRTKGKLNPPKNQGGCGSCWAFASVAGLESHIAIQTGKLFSFSEQQLVSCVQNENNCGGSGGCEGATAEVAYNYVAGKGVGITTEDVIPYTASDSHCPIQDEEEEEVLSLRGARDTVDSTLKFSDAVATIDGYADVKTNDYLGLMNAVAKWGPAVIAVAASPWMMYMGGVFSPSSGGHSAYDINHGVLVVGYGTDEESGKDYWIVRNSWGEDWGEGGYIRLERKDPSTLENEDDNCGWDTTPKDGVQCDVDEDGNAPPSKVKVCGTSGILFDATVPVGGKLLN